MHLYCPEQHELRTCHSAQVLLSFTFVMSTSALCSGHFCHYSTQYSTAVWQMVLLWRWPSYPLRSPTQYIISEGTACAPRGHVLTSVLRRSRAWGIASFSTHRVDQVSSWLHQSMHPTALSIPTCLVSHKPSSHRHSALVIPVPSLFSKLSFWN